MATGRKLILTVTGHSDHDMKKMLHNPGKHAKQQKRAKRITGKILRRTLKSADIEICY